MVEMSPDRDFAQLLDLQCTNCRNGYPLTIKLN